MTWIEYRLNRKNRIKMKWIKRKLGITELIEKQNKANELLVEIAKQAKRSADLQQRYNEAYHVK